VILRRRRKPQAREASPSRAFISQIGDASHARWQNLSETALQTNANTNKNKDHINDKFWDEMHAEFIVHYWS